MILLLISMAATDLAYYHEFAYQNIREREIAAERAEKERINYETALAIREAGKMIEQ